MTNNWVDIKNANVILIMGGNAAEAHPVGFKWVVEAQTKNDATVVVETRALTVAPPSPICMRQYALVQTQYSCSE